MAPHLTHRAPSCMHPPAVRMALKFRQKIFYEEGASETMAEIEGNNAMITEQKKSIRNLFPRMYCCIALVTQCGLHWEAIGTEYLYQIPRTLFTARPKLLAQCYKILTELHKRGFWHGDPHLGNFMLYSDERVTFIDQDKIQPLPKGLAPSSTFSPYPARRPALPTLTANLESCGYVCIARGSQSWVCTPYSPIARVHMRHG